ncbi:hypothetical protein KH5_02390 [Urechidicola sp. KH5]
MKQKIRGHKRFWKDIEQWIDRNKDLNLETVKNCGRDYVKFRVHPWGSLNLGNSITPEPHGKTRRLILNGFLEIYNNWKLTIEALEEPYYLKFWLYESNLAQSQVVCAIGEYINYYNQVFTVGDTKKNFPINNYRSHYNLFIDFEWSLGIDESIFEDNTNDPNFYINELAHQNEVRWLQKQLKKPHRIVQQKQPRIYAFPKGNVWIGTLKN